MTVSFISLLTAHCMYADGKLQELLLLLITIVTVSFLSLLTVRYMNAGGKLQELLILLLRAL